MVKDLPGSQETLGFPGFDPWVGKREEEMATHSSLPACRIPWIEEPGRASGAGGVQTAKASRKQSSLSGKESAQGCLPKRLLGRPD